MTNRQYNFKCRMGNWQEDLNTSIVTEEKFQRLQANKGLLSDKREEVLLKQRFPVSVPLEDCLKNGAVISLRNRKTGGRLSCFPSKLQVCTSILTDDPICRNAFIIKCNTKEVDEPLCYGDRIFFETHPKLLDQPHFLRSERVSLVSRSKSNQQLVSLSLSQDQSTLWKFEQMQPNNRMLSEGSVLTADDLNSCFFIIRHVATNLPLASHFVDAITDFGIEYETTCHAYYIQGQKRICERSQRGELTGLTREEMEENHWQFVWNS